MADDNNFQNRTSNPPDRGAASGGQGTDPLAELARLIGQNDPYSDFGRDPRAPAPPAPRPTPAEQPLVGQPFANARNQPEPVVAYQVGQQDVQAFTQEAQDAGGYRGAAYRDSNQMSPVGDFYDEAEPSGRRRGFTTVMAVVVLAVIGTVGAFGYRFVFSGGGSNTPPPVIRANPDPTKVPPPVASGDPSQSKATYDRVGDRSQGERVVTREEPPVDARDLNRPNVARNAPPPSSPANQWASAAAPNLPSTSTVSSPPGMALGEPKKVRTVPIRPESTEANMTPPALTPPGGSAPGANSANARATANTPTFVAPPSRQPAANQPAAPSANAPLSLNDDASPALPRMTPPPPAAQARQAPPPAQRQTGAPQALAPPRQAQQAPPAAPTRIATATPAAGGYLVQVSSQRSEAEAQAALRSLQAKYPTIGGQPATIRRADLPERGTFYRAMIGPFASRDQATQLCESLKAAGGSCIVQGN